jgi:hypothetical protein
VRWGLNRVSIVGSEIGLCSYGGVEIFQRVGVGWYGGQFEMCFGLISHASTNNYLHFMSFRW